VKLLFCKSNLLQNLPKIVISIGYFELNLAGGSLFMGTHTISNSSTLHGWLESMGLDDILLNPCACIFGDDEPPPPIPLPGRNKLISIVI
jgi:hypothetical protein